MNENMGKNNFEKWKDGLTLDDMVEILSQDCDKCPLNNTETDCIGRSEGFGYCGGALKKWGGKK